MIQPPYRVTKLPTGSPYQIGGYVRVWWNTGLRDGDWYLARVLGVSTYTGRYPELFTHSLVLHAPETRHGTTSMCVDVNTDHQYSITTEALE